MLHNIDLLTYSFFSVRKECGAVEPDEIELRKLVLVPDEGGIDVVNTANQVHQGVVSQGGKTALSYMVPQHFTLNVVDQQVQVDTLGFKLSGDDIYLFLDSA